MEKCLVNFIKLFRQIPEIIFRAMYDHAIRHACNRSQNFLVEHGRIFVEHGIEYPRYPYKAFDYLNMLKR